LGGGEILSWLETADSLISRAEQRTAGNSGTYESGIPEGYTAEEWLQDERW